MADSLDDIREAVRQTLVDSLRLETAASQIAFDQPLHGAGGIGLGSLEIFELISALEERFDMQIPDEAIARLNSVNAIADHIAAHGVPSRVAD